MKKTILLFILVCFGQAAFTQEAQSDLLQMKVDLVYLASDLLEGREAGTKGEEMAAEYIVSRFKDIGLQPMGTDGTWSQPFEFKYNANPHALDKGAARKGKNILGYIDNGASSTVIIGAHYDHLGMGMPGASLYNGDPAIHNGADDNASGVAALLQLAERLNAAPVKNNNYLFIAFSGEELGLYGSKFFVNNPTIDLGTVNYMFNMDMVGRLNEERSLAVYGVGTSPAWKEKLEKLNDGKFKIKTTESGIGPSDHTSFYLKDLPVLHFFTGQHGEYHKPTDDSGLVNFQGIADITDFIMDLITDVNAEEKLAFTKTKDEQKQAASFKVTLGVMPDYVYDGEGMRIDAVLDDRPAKAAGIEGGDIIIQIGDLEVKTIYDYMEGLGRYKKGDKATVKVQRKKKVLEKEVVF